MKEYAIKIYNESGAVAYEEIVKAENENEALKQVIEQCIVYIGDTIQVLEVI